MTKYSKIWANRRLAPDEKLFLEPRAKRSSRLKVRQIIRSKKFQKIQFFGVMNFKNCVYISWKILTILRHKITQIFTKKYYLLSKFWKLHNLETQKIKWNPWNLVTTLRKSCFLGPTIFEIPQPNWYYYTWSLNHWNILISIEISYFKWRLRYLVLILKYYW